MPDPIDIVVPIALPLRHEAMLQIGLRAERFMSSVKDNATVWFCWKQLSRESCDAYLQDQITGNRALQALADQRYFPLAIGMRCCRAQHAQDVGLEAFWRGHGYRLTERSYSLLANDYGLFQLLVHFRFEPESETIRPEDRSKFIRHVFQSRPIYEHIDQHNYVSKAMRDAKREVQRVCHLMLEKFEPIEPLPDHAYLSPARDTGFPCAFARAVDSSVMSIFDHDEMNAGLRFVQPTANQPFWHIGWNYGLVSEIENTKYGWSLIAMMTFMQFSYYNIRYLQGFMIGEMERHFADSKNIDLELASQRFDQLTLNFERFSLDYDRYLGSRIPKIHEPARAIEQMWNIPASIERLRSSVEYQRTFLHTQHDHQSHRDNRRQEFVLFVIALLQIFALVSVLVDYVDLNQSLQRVLENEAQQPVDSTNSAWWLEAWIVEMGPILPRILFGLSLVLIAVFYGRSIVSGIYRIKSRIHQWLEQLQKPETANIELKDTAIRCRRGRSRLHHEGLFCEQACEPGETIMRFHAGREVDADDYFNSENQDAEWNAVEGKRLFVRKHSTEYRLINHSRQPNATVKFDEINLQFEVVADRPLTAGDEVLIDYRREPLPETYLVHQGGYL